MGIFETDASTVQDAVFAKGNDIPDFGEIINSCRGILSLKQDFFGPLC